WRDARPMRPCSCSNWRIGTTGTGPWTRTSASGRTSGPCCGTVRTPACAVCVPTSSTASPGWASIRTCSCGATRPRRTARPGGGEFDSKHQLPREKRQPLVERLGQIYRDDEDPGVHSAIDWLLRSRWDQGKQLDEIDRKLAGKRQRHQRWDVTKREEHTLVVFRDPGGFAIGSPADEPGRGSEGVCCRRRLARAFSCATAE